MLWRRSIGQLSTHCQWKSLQQGETFSATLSLIKYSQQWSVKSSLHTISDYILTATTIDINTERSLFIIYSIVPSNGVPLSIPPPPLMTEFSDHTLDKATKAKVTLENYYSNLITQHGERKQRLAKLEASLKDETLSETQKQVSGPFLNAISARD